MAFTSFLALYRGRTVGEARMVAVCADPRIVADFAARLLEQPDPDAEDDPVLRAIEDARREGLRVVAQEAGHA